MYRSLGTAANHERVVSVCVPFDIAAPVVKAVRGGGDRAWATGRVSPL